MRKTIMFFAVSTIFLVTAHAAQPPKCVQNGNDVFVCGKTDEVSAAPISVKLIDKETGEIAYITQSSTDCDGEFSVPVQIKKDPSLYDIFVYADDMLFDKNNEFLDSDSRYEVELSAVNCGGIASASVDLTDYYGLYGLDKIPYTLFLSCYSTHDGTDRLVGFKSTGNLQANIIGKTQKTISIPVPEETDKVKAFLWNGTDQLVPLSDSKTAVKRELTTQCFDNKEWKSVNMVTQSMLDNGIIGGEGCQRIMSMAISADDMLVFCGNDTGGLNRSTDGGRTWEDCFGGLYSSGVTAIAIDPKNKNRILAAGAPQVSDPSTAGSTINSITGLYLSENGGDTWKMVLNQPGAVTRFDFREAICYDKSSYDAKSDLCTTAYWSRPWRLQGNAGGALLSNDAVKCLPNDKSGLWKTTDGGTTWENVNTNMSDGIIKVNPINGTVFVANVDGLHRSKDGGKTFKTLVDGVCYGLDIVDNAKYPNYVWINNKNGVFVSKDNGDSFTKVSDNTYPSFCDGTGAELLKITRGIKVSPKNPNKMVLGWFNGFSVHKRYYSVNGGATWKLSSYNDDDDFFVSNSRHPLFMWANLNENKVYSTGGDWLTSSNDGGAEYKWDYNGGGDVHVDQRTIFNIYNPDIMYYGSQDYHGALTTDYGKTWKHIWKVNNSLKYGRVYGTYAADENTLVAIRYNDSSNTREICVSYDAGESWNATGCMVEGKGWCKWGEMCFQSPTDKNVLFASKWRSDDFGKTWSKMSGVQVVCEYNPYGEKQIFGVYDDEIRVSYDNGVTWNKYTKVLTNLESSKTQIWDIAYDGISDTMYYISGNSSSGIIFAKYHDGEHTDLTNNINRHPAYGCAIKNCAVDPRLSGIVYVGGTSSNCINPNGVQCSLDGGKTFSTLTVNGDENSVVKSGPDGGLNPYDIIVHPKTGDVWVAQGCNGWAVFPAPYN